MNSDQLDQKLNDNPITARYFRGTYAADKLPKYIEHVPTAYVVNEDFSWNPGTHWVAIFVRTLHHVEYFDSLGNAPTPTIAEYLTSFPYITRNVNAYQSKFSTVCGLYTMFFIYLCSLGYSIEHIELILSEQSNPDKFVTEFINKYM